MNKRTYSTAMAGAMIASMMAMTGSTLDDLLEPDPAQQAWNEAHTNPSGLRPRHIDASQINGKWQGQSRKERRAQAREARRA